jgi:hypothetical protein
MHRSRAGSEKERGKMFDMKRPCVDCPFRKGVGETFQLSMERLKEIKHGTAFPCHKTIDYDSEPVPQKLVDRFHARYVVDATTGCWNWTSGLDAYGYGVIGFGPRKKNKTFKAHRLSWEIHTGLGLLPEVDVCHSCDNPKCVNPSHLFIGSNAANQLDAVSKGHRSNYRPIPISDVESMRKEYEFGSKTSGLKQLAEKYRCSVGQVHNIVTMRSRVNYKNEPQQCAGLMAVLLRDKATNPIMQVAERIGGIDFSGIDPYHEAYESWAHVIKAHTCRAA